MNSYFPSSRQRRIEAMELKERRDWVAAITYQALLISLPADVTMATAAKQAVQAADLLISELDNEQN